MANRIADIRDLSHEELMRLEPADLEFANLPAGFHATMADDGPWRFEVCCPGCEAKFKSRGSLLGQKVRCPKCQREFVAEWGEPVPHKHDT
jgi:hypothetical protein